MYHKLNDDVIPRYVNNKKYLKLVLAELFLILDPYRSKNPIATGAFALWLHGFKDKDVYEYLYEKNNFELPSIDIFATTEKAYDENLKVIEPISGKGRLVKIRVFNYNAQDLAPLSYQHGFTSQKQLFNEAPKLTVNILEIKVIPFYFLECNPIISNYDRTFVKNKLRTNSDDKNSCIIA